MMHVPSIITEVASMESTSVEVASMESTSVEVASMESTSVEAAPVGAWRNIMKKHGKELILTDVDDYILASAINNSVTYEGNIYCSRLQRNKVTEQMETIVTVYDLDGNSMNAQIPITQPTAEMEYTGDWLNIKSDFHSTEGYKDYLGEDLTYQTFYAKDEAGLPKSL